MPVSNTRWVGLRSASREVSIPKIVCQMRSPTAPEREDADANDPRADSPPGPPECLRTSVNHPAGHGHEARVEEGMPRREERFDPVEVAVRPAVDEEPGDEPSGENGSDQVVPDGRPPLGLRLGERDRGQFGHGHSLARGAEFEVRGLRQTSPAGGFDPGTQIQASGLEQLVMAQSEGFASSAAAGRRTQPSSPVYDGNDVVLTFRGEAEAVHLLTWMPMFPTPPPFTRVGPDTWQLTAASTKDGSHRVPVGGTRRMVEPCRSTTRSNPPAATNPFGSNSVLVGRDYQTAVVCEASAARLPEASFTKFGSRRRLWAADITTTSICRMASKPGPAIRYSWSTTDLTSLHFADLAGCLDRLIESGIVASMAVVLLDPWNRMAEYGANPAHSRHLVGEVLPHIVRRLRLRPTAVGALGSSLGAVAALAAAWHHPAAVVRLWLSCPAPSLTQLAGDRRSGGLRPDRRLPGRLRGRSPPREHCRVSECRPLRTTLRPQPANGADHRFGGGPSRLSGNLGRASLG